MGAMRATKKAKSGSPGFESGARNVRDSTFLPWMKSTIAPYSRELMLIFTPPLCVTPPCPGPIGFRSQSDAAGLPVVTCPGEKFASRVAASLLAAAGLQEGIACDLKDYEDKVFEMATNPAKLKTIKSRLRDNRSSLPLFDSRRQVRMGGVRDCPVAASQTRAVLSLEAVTTRRPSGLKLA